MCLWISVVCKWQNSNTLGTLQHSATRKWTSTSLSFIRLKDARRATAKWLCCSSIISSNFCCSCGDIGTLGTAKWLHIKHPGWSAKAKQTSLEEGWSHKCLKQPKITVNHEGVDVHIISYYSQLHFARAYSNNRSTTVSWHWGTRRDRNCWMCQPVQQSAAIHPFPPLCWAWAWHQWTNPKENVWCDLNI